MTLRMISAPLEPQTWYLSCVQSGSSSLLTCESKRSRYGRAAETDRMSQPVLTRNHSVRVSKVRNTNDKNNCHKHRFKEMVWWYRNYSFIVFFIRKNSAQHTNNHKLGIGSDHTGGRVQLCWMPRTGDWICAPCRRSESLLTHKHTLTFKQPKMHEARHPDRHKRKIYAKSKRKSIIWVNSNTRTSIDVLQIKQRITLKRPECECQRASEHPSIHFPSLLVPHSG